MVASDHAVACGEESQCLSGSPVPMTGAMTTGMPAIRLDSVYRLLLMSTVRLGVIFALTILISSLPRSTGPSWRMMAMPNQMRIIEDHPVQGESDTMFRTVTAMVSDVPRRVCMRVQMSLARMGAGRSHRSLSLQHSRSFVAPSTGPLFCPIWRGGG